MLFETKFDPTKQFYYNSEWGVVLNRKLAYDARKFRESIQNGAFAGHMEHFDAFIDRLSTHIEEKYNETKLVRFLLSTFCLSNCNYSRRLRAKRYARRWSRTLRKK